jgi:hypothetical protein
MTTIELGCFLRTSGDGNATRGRCRLSADGQFHRKAVAGSDAASFYAALRASRPVVLGTEWHLVEPRWVKFWGRLPLSSVARGLRQCSRSPIGLKSSVCPSTRSVCRERYQRRSAPPSDRSRPGQKIKIRVSGKEVASITTSGMPRFTMEAAIAMAEEMIDGPGMD